MRHLALLASRLAAALVPAAALWGCAGGDGDGGTQPPALTPAYVQVVSAATVSDTVGHPVADSVAVRVVSAGGLPVPGVQVTWSPGAESGTAAPAASTTNGSGIAATRWTLGTKAGPQTLSASVVGTDGPAVFTATAVSGPPAVIRVIPSALVVPVGEYGDLEAIRLEDAYGNKTNASISYGLRSSDTSVVLNAGRIFGAGAGRAQLYVVVNGYGEVPVDVTVTRPTIASLSAGAASGVTCAASTAGGAYCWGDSGVYIRGREGRNTPRPVRVSGAYAFTKVSATAGVACGIDAGAVWCWRVEKTSPPQTLPPVRAAGGNAFTDLAIGLHRCGISDGGLFCWESSDFQTLPKAVAAGSFTALAASKLGSCALATGGVPWCWGSNPEGQLGRADCPSYGCASPAPITSGRAFVRLRMGTNNTCGQAADGSWYCWGRADYNLLRQPFPQTCGPSGSPQHTCSGDPVLIQTTPALVSLAPGTDAICGLTAGGQAYCWGAGRAGQLGNGSTADSPALVPVAGGHTFTALMGGDGHFCGLTSEGQVWCWGANGSGQLGDGTFIDRAVPVPAI